jgi:cell division protein FtsB
VRALRTDPDALERVARDDLGMIRDDELLFVFTDDE